MPALSEKIANLLSYAGLATSHYALQRTAAAYDPENRLSYYLDKRGRAKAPEPTDSRGIPQITIGNRQIYLPTHLLLFGLGQLQLWQDSGDKVALEKFRLVADWLIENQSDDHCWLTEIPKPRYNLDEPFRSAMVQGLGISVLVRANQVCHRDRYAEAATRALIPFTRDVIDGGVTTYSEQGPFFEEYPGQPARHVLNGAIYALWGLYDLSRLHNDSNAGELWESGVACLKHWLPQFDLGYWSRYHVPDNPRNPATVKYHLLHIDQLDALHAITGDQLFAEYRDRWRHYLSGRCNALRTLPSKVSWKLYRGETKVSTNQP